MMITWAFVSIIELNPAVDYPLTPFRVPMSAALRNSAICVSYNRGGLSTSDSRELTMHVMLTEFEIAIPVPAIVLPFGYF